MKRAGRVAVPGLAVGALLLMALAGWMSLGPGVLEVSTGLERYTTEAGELRATVWITNASQAHVTVALGSRCRVETPRGMTNYVAGLTNGWLWLRPKQGLALASSRYLIPLPVDVRRWSFSLAARRQTGKERITTLLVRWGVVEYRELHRHPVRFLVRLNSGLEPFDQRWDEIRSGWIEGPMDAIKDAR